MLVMITNKATGHFELNGFERYWLSKPIEKAVKTNFSFEEAGDLLWLVSDAIHWHQEREFGTGFNPVHVATSRRPLPPGELALVSLVMEVLPYASAVLSQELDSFTSQA